MGSTSHYKILTSKTFWHPCFSFLEVGFLAAGVSGNSPSCPFPRMKASDSHSRIIGMDVFIPFPFPNFGDGFFSFPSRSRIMGMDLFIPFPFPNFGNVCFHSLPVPEIWECFFSFPSSSRIVGMDFFHSRICYFTDGNQNGNWITMRDTNFSASSTFFKTIILRR